MSRVPGFHWPAWQRQPGRGIGGLPQLLYFLLLHLCLFALQRWIYGRHTLNFVRHRLHLDYLILILVRWLLTSSCAFQALAQGKLVKNRTLYRVSPAHIQALARAEDTTKSSGELIDRRDSSHFVESEPAAAPVRTPEKLRLGDVHTKENPIIKNAAMAADDRGTRIEAIDGSGRRGGLGGGRSGGGILGRGSRSGGRERRGGRGSRGGGRGGRGGSAQGCIEDDGSRGEGLSPSAASRMRDASMFEARTTEAWQSPDFPGTAGASLVGGEVVKAEATAAAASAVVGSAAKLEQPQQGTPSSTPRQRIPKRSSSESAAISLVSKETCGSLCCGVHRSSIILIFQ